MVGADSMGQMASFCTVVFYDSMKELTHSEANKICSLWLQLTV